MHKNQIELSNDLKKTKIVVGDRYFHYKNPNQFYSVISIGFIETTEEPCVVYRGEYGENIVWIRTAKDFLSKVKLQDGSKVDRFTKVE